MNNDNKFILLLSWIILSAFGVRIFVVKKENRKRKVKCRNESGAFIKS